ncbi:phage minor capsid protein [[Clostridium] symbiosum]|uniref:phage minor capsid protein n=2 Tax=Clostridium symbiosum TaxID=1512 RepID=UPI0032194DE4
MQHNEYDIGAALKAIEDELIASMIRNVDRHRAEETKEGYNWSMWQAEQLKALEKYKRENQKRYSKQFKSINGQIGELLYQARQTGNMQQEIQILKAIQRGYRFPNMPKKLFGLLEEMDGKTFRQKASLLVKRWKGKEAAQATAEFFKLNDRKLEALIKATTQDMERAETAVLRMANDQYRKAIFNAQVYANSGAGTYEKAVDMATRDMLSRGLNCVEYANGARHTLADYADMAIRTASKRAYLQGEGEKRQEWGLATVIMNKRGNPCPKCLPFVGKVLIDDVWSGGKKVDGPYPLMSTAIAAGLYHPRCKDSHTTYFPGISTADVTWTKEELEAIEKTNQRQAERQHAARQVERFGRLAEFSLHPENKKKYQQKKNKWKQRLAQYRQADIMKTEGWTDEAIERRRLDEAAIAGHKSEYAILYDERGNKLFKKHGGQHEVIYTDDEWALMKNGVSTHNHPLGATFSPDDICVLKESGLKEIRAVGRDGVFVLKQPDIWPDELSSPDKIFAAYDTIQKELEPEFIQAYMDGRITDEHEYSILYQARILEELTDKYQLNYFVEKR